MQQIEVLLIDDGSIDNTLDIAEFYATQDQRLIVVDSQSRGIVAALNRGLQLARTDLIARMDADDIMLAQRLKLQYRYLCDHPDTALVASQAELFPTQDIKAGYQEYMRWQNACLSHEDICHEMYVESPLAHPSVMYRKSVVCDLGWYKEGAFPEDYELWLRMFHSGCRFHKLAQVHIQWRESNTRASRTEPQYSRQAFDQLRAEYLSKDARLCSDRPLVVWGAGRKTRQRVAHIISKGARVTMWIDIDPNKIDNKVSGAWVRSPTALLKAASSEKPFVLCYVNNHGARNEIADQLHQYGYDRGLDYLMVG